jgi:hypothetical protein
MSTSSDEILRSFDHLPLSEKRAIASEIIRRMFATPAKSELDETELSALYAEFAAEDRALAENGIGEYAAGLAKEDA